MCESVVGKNGEVIIGENRISSPNPFSELIEAGLMLIAKLLPEPTEVIGPDSPEHGQLA